MTNVTFALAISGFVLMPAKTVSSFICTNYSGVPNRRVVLNKHVGRKFSGNLISI